MSPARADTGLGELVAEGVGLEELVGEGEGEGEVVGVACGKADFAGTPLFQTIFLPVFMHVNIRPELSRLAPIFEHDAPAFIGLAANVGRVDIGRAINSPMAISLAKLRVGTLQSYKRGNLFQGFFHGRVQSCVHSFIENLCHDSLA